MRGQTIVVTDQLVTETCCNCHVLFAITERLKAERLKAERLNSHKSFWCPNGHAQSYRGKSEAEKLREEKLRLEQSLDAARSQTTFWRAEQEREKRQHAATKGALTKTKKRVAGGACPCCNRSFVDVARHMKTKHPTYTKET